MNASSDEVCKVILLGNGSVGKTSIIQRFTDDGFNRVYKQTVGLDFVEKRITIRGDKRVNLQVWDIGGQNAASFADVEDWHRKVTKTIAQVSSSVVSGPKVPKPHIYLLGNKIDMLEDKEEMIDKHDKYVRKHKLNGKHYVSAKTGDKVLSVFYSVAAEVSGIKLSAYELSFHDKVVSATVVKEDIIGHTDDPEDSKNNSGGGGYIDDIARQIELEDKALEEAKRKREARKKCVLM